MLLLNTFYSSHTLWVSLVSQSSYIIDTALFTVYTTSVRLTLDVEY